MHSRTLTNVRVGCLSENKQTKCICCKKFVHVAKVTQLPSITTTTNLADQSSGIWSMWLKSCSSFNWRLEKRQQMKPHPYSIYSPSPALWASSWERELTATLHREQYISFFAFSSSVSAEEGASWEEVREGGGGAAGDEEEVTGAGGGRGGEALEEGKEGEEEEEKRPGAGRAVGGLEGGGSLPGLLEEGEVEEGGEKEGRTKGLRVKESVRPDKRSGGRMGKRRKTRSNKLIN